LLHIHYSNSVAVLADRLIDKLGGCLDDPLNIRTVVVPHPEMGRWLARRMANRSGICANINFELPSACLWRLIAQRNPEMPAQNPLDPEVLSLRLLAAFSHKPPAPLKEYLHGKDLMAELSLARQLAHLFDQYLTYRHHWILDWESGGGASWQAALWRRLGSGQDWHWARVLGWLFETGHKVKPCADQPQGLEVIALPSLAPEFVRAFAALAQSSDISFYQWSPCSEYWGDIAGRRQTTTTPTDHLEIGNSLLGSLGCQLRDFSDLLLEYETSSDEEYHPPKLEGCLARLQSEVLSLTAPVKPQAVEQGSIQIHACHSRRREIEVCHDRLLDLFEQIPDLKPHEVQVLAPDISQYAADIESAFGAAAAAARLPFRIIGPRKQPAGAASTCLELLRAMCEPVSNRVLLELLASKALARCFHVDVDSRELISRWIAVAGAYGETDSTAEGGGKFGWDAAAQRLLLDSMLEDSSWLADRLRPAGPVASSDLDLLGAFLEMVDALTAAQKTAERDRSLEDWCAWSSRTLGRFLLLDAQGEYEKQVVSTAVERLRKRVLVSGYSDLVELRLFLHLLEPEVEALATGTQGVPGGITFASASSQRLIPARVIYALGLNDGEFPAPEYASELDLIARSPRRGDGSRRQDDRQIFLEWLCNAGDTLLLSYIGRDIRDNSERTPSPVVGELLDYLGCSGAAQTESIKGVIEHPAQAFSRRYGRSDGLFTYNSNYVVDEAASGKQGFLDQSLPEFELDQITLTELVSFLVNPARQFLSQRLGAWLAIDRQPMEPMAPTGVNTLAAFVLKRDMIEQQLAGWAAADSKAWALSDVAVPDTPVGQAAVEAMFSVSTKTARQVRRLVADKESRSVRGSISLAGLMLAGQVGEIYDRTRVIFRAGKARPKVYLQLWIEHLFCNALEVPDAAGITSIAVCEDKQIEIGPVDDASQFLETLLTLYLAGQTQPLPLIPEASRAFAKRYAKGEQIAVKAANEALVSNEHKRGDDAEVHISRMLKAGLELDQDFQDNALAVWLPLMDHLR
jgi:exodeoxyribonuclease V gamma subunit